jgi:formiminotetrahydrofolate cyclodeaminase
MNKLSELPLGEFCAAVYSEAPAPGGGSVSALVGALAAALAGMVANLSSGSDCSAEAQMQKICGEAAQLQKTLLGLVDEDAESFDRVMEAYKLPKGTEAEKAERKSAIQISLKGAAETPLKAAKTAAKIFPLVSPLLEKGNPNALTDAMIAAMSARNAVLGCLLNVRINLSSIRDADYVRDTLQEVERLELLARISEERLLATGYLKLN